MRCLPLVAFACGRAAARAVRRDGIRSLGTGVVIATAERSLPRSVLAKRRASPAAHGRVAAGMAADVPVGRPRSSHSDRAPRHPSKRTPRRIRAMTIFVTVILAHA